MGVYIDDKERYTIKYDTKKYNDKELKKLENIFYDTYNYYSKYYDEYESLDDCFNIKLFTKK